MSRPKRLYTSFDGRIDRKTYWGAVLRLNIVPFALVILLSVWFSSAIMANVGNGLRLFELQIAQARFMAWFQAAMFFIFALPNLAIAVKRRHDRGNSGRDVAAYFALAAVTWLLYALGVDWTFASENLRIFPKLGLWSTVVGIIQCLLSVYFFVVLGCLKGTTGPNHYGPDPIAPVGATDAVHAASGATG
jgi:uncharacterized membrane protein YhaH (DUF805 family)